MAGKTRKLFLAILVVLSMTVMSFGSPAPKTLKDTCPPPIPHGPIAGARAPPRKPAVRDDYATPGSGSIGPQVKRMNDPAVPAAHPDYAVTFQSTGFDRLQLLLGSTHQDDVKGSGLLLSDRTPDSTNIRSPWGERSDSSDAPELALMLTALAPMLQLMVHDPKLSPLEPYSSGPFKQTTWRGNWADNTEGLTITNNVRDGIIIRGRGAYNKPPTHLAPPQQALALESAAITSQWMSETSGQWGQPSWPGFGRLAVKEQRQKLRYIVDAYIEDQESISLIKNIDEVLQGGPGSIGNWPPQQQQNQIYMAGSTKFNQLLGSYSGKWVSEVILSYNNNKQADRLGHKIITHVVVWVPDPACGFPTLAWTIDDYTLERAQAIRNVHA